MLDSTVIVVVDNGRLKDLVRTVVQIRAIVEFNVGIVVISDQSIEFPRALIMDVGADQITSFGTSCRVFRAVLDAVVRRTPALQRSHHFDYRKVRVSLSQYRIWIEKDEILLTKSQFLIFALLVENAEKFVRREVFLNKVFETKLETYRALDVHICAIRRKIEPYGYRISTRRLIGYGLWKHTEIEAQPA